MEDTVALFAKDAKDLTAGLKAMVLREAKEYLKTVNGDTATHPTIREVVAQGLYRNGYWHWRVGGNREMTTTIEIGRALGLEKGLTAVELWGNTTSRVDILRGLDTTIAYLQ